MKKGLLSILLLSILLFSNCVTAVIMDPSVDYVASDFTLNSRVAINVSYINLSTNWINLGSATYGNITFADNMSSSDALIERGGHCGIGNYTTNVTVDVYSPATWTTTVYFRYYTNNSVLDQNTTVATYIQHNTSHRRYYTDYNPSNTLAIADMGGFNIDSFVRATNATLTYGGNRTFHNFTTVYALTPPYNQNGTYNTSSNAINITWTNGNNSDTTVIVRNNATYPVCPTDGYIVQNDTSTSFNASNVNTTRFYSAFSYNATTNSWSLPLQLGWGALAISVFNESAPHQAIGFDIEISDSDALVTVTATNQINILYIDLNSIPYGDDTIIVISNSSYKTTVVYADLAISNFYNYTFYLIPVEVPGAGGPGGNNNSLLCLISVIDEMGQAVPDADVEVRRYINTTGSYETVRRIPTDGNGQISTWLEVNQLYFFDITKEGYTQLGTKYWTPTELLYTKTFMLSFNESVPGPGEIIIEEISFTGSIAASALTLIYTDNMEQTINLTIYIYELNHSTNITTLIQINTSTNNTFTTAALPINTSNTFLVYLHYNHTTWGYQTQMLIFEPGVTPLTTPSRINIILEPLLGYHPIGWGNFLMLMFVIAVFFYVDQKDAGIIVIMLGGMFLFLNIGVGFNDTLQTFSGGFIPVLFIVVGILSMWNSKKQRVIT